jgi:hypothetical protein
MLDEGSRYAHLATRELATPDGRHIVYLTRRLIPPAASYQAAGRRGVTDSDRLDLVTYQTLGSAVAFWQVADANEAMHPAELTARAGRVLVIPLPRHPGTPL